MEWRRWRSAWLVCPRKSSRAAALRTKAAALLKRFNEDFWTRLCHGNSIEHALGAEGGRASCRGDGVLPLSGCSGSENPQGGSGDEVALKS